MPCQDSLGPCNPHKSTAAGLLFPQRCTYLRKYLEQESSDGPEERRILQRTDMFRVNAKKRILFWPYRSGLERERRLKAKQHKLLPKSPLRWIQINQTLSTAPPLLPRLKAVFNPHKTCADYRSPVILRLPNEEKTQMFNWNLKNVDVLWGGLHKLKISHRMGATTRQSSWWCPCLR